MTLQVRWLKDSSLHPRQWQGITKTRRRYEHRVGELREPLDTGAADTTSGVDKPLEIVGSDRGDSYGLTPHTQPMPELPSRWNNKCGNGFEGKLQPLGCAREIRGPHIVGPRDRRRVRNDVRIDCHRPDAATLRTRRAGQVGAGTHDRGTRDLLLSNTVRMHRKLRQAGIEAGLQVFEAQQHA